MEARGQLLGVGSLLLLCGTQGLNSATQTWQQMPLPAQPSHTAEYLILYPLLVS